MGKSKLNICVVDNIGGCYLPSAIKLSQYFNKTYYYSVSQNPFPRLSTEMVGVGYEQIIVINEFWNKLDLFDLIIFTDIYFNDWGQALRKMGKLVFGGTDGEFLETNRKLFKDELKKAGMPIATTTYIKGVKNLKSYLSDKKDKWVKISYYRGEQETFHFIDASHNETTFIEMLYTMGPLESELEFSIEDPITSVCESGFDGWTINGQFTDNCIYGFEIKNAGYVGKKTTKKDLPAPVRECNEKFGPVLAKYKHTGFYSTEIRCTENGTNYYTDPCMRLGSPPSNTYLEMISNWDEIIPAACQGKLVEPIFKGVYGVEIILKSNCVNNNFLPVKFPPQYKKNINLKGSFFKNNEFYIIPFKYTGFELQEFGSVVVVGDDLTKIIDQALSIAAQVEGFDIFYDANCLEKATDVIRESETYFKNKFSDFKFDAENYPDEGDIF